MGKKYTTYVMEDGMHYSRASEHVSLEALIKVTESLKQSVLNI